MRRHRTKLCVVSDYQLLDLEAFGVGQRPRFAAFGSCHALIQRGLRTSIEIGIHIARVAQEIGKVQHMQQRADHLKVAVAVSQADKREMVFQRQPLHLVGRQRQ
ncbi:hypothetical protein WI37_16265 [Burkholderia ubonensis]|nr:hypothetical protein WI37_16265 [Burkholderia ubonensis]